MVYVVLWFVVCLALDFDLPVGVLLRLFGGLFGGGGFVICLVWL